MPDAVVLQIADALVAKSVSAGFKSTGFLTDVGKLWALEQNAPAAYLGDAGERLEEKPTQSITSLAGFFFYTIVKGNAPTRLFYPLYKALQDVIDADPRLGTLCHRARVTGYTSLNTEANIADRVHVADVFVEVDYRHPRGAA